MKGGFMNKPIIKKFTFSSEERDRLRNLEIGIIASNAQLDGIQIYKNALLGAIYKRLGIDGEAKKGYSKGISYNLSENMITYTESPLPEVKASEAKK